MMPRQCSISGPSAVTELIGFTCHLQQTTQLQTHYKIFIKIISICVSTKYFVKGVSVTSAYSRKVLAKYSGEKLKKKQYL